MQDYQKSPEPTYEGKASLLFAVQNEPDLLIIQRKDHVTKQDGKVRDSIEGKGVYTNRISNILFRLLRKAGIPTHFVRELSDTETLIRRADPFLLEVIVRNLAAGSLCKRLPFETGAELPEPMFELCYKSDSFGDPFISDQQAVFLHLLKDYDEADTIRELALSINTVLWNFFQKIGIILVDFKIEFGRTPDGKIILIDEISPDTCRFWDAKTRESLDKDIFRNGHSNDETYAAYQEIFNRLTAQLGTDDEAPAS